MPTTLAAAKDAFPFIGINQRTAIPHRELKFIGLIRHPKPKVTAWIAVPESVFQQVSEDLANDRCRNRYSWKLSGWMPAAALQIGRSSGACQQRLQTVWEQLRLLR